MRALFFGDSITQGFWGIDGGWVERIRRHYDSRSIQDFDHMQPEVFNLGISGDTTRNLLTRIEAETRVRKGSDPLVVLVAIGSNDDLFESDKQWVRPEEFHSNLETILAILRPLADAIVFVGNPACDEAQTTPVAWGDYHYTNREMQRSEQTMREVAEAHSITFVPIFDAFKARLDAGDSLLQDGLHPNDAGHQFIFERVLPMLDAVVGRLK